MARVERAAVVDLDPAAAYDLWTDISRWPTFVDGFGHVERVDDDWPAQQAKIVWRSGPAGRGVVTERIIEARPGEEFATHVFEGKLTGTQRIKFAALEEGTGVELSYDYRLQSANPLSRLTDVLFIRRAQGDALARTLRRFSVEAAEEAAL